MANNEDETKITIARLEAMPSNIHLSIGSYGTFDKWELIDSVKKDNEVGVIVRNMMMASLRSFKKTST